MNYKTNMAAGSHRDPLKKEKPDSSAPVKPVVNSKDLFQGNKEVIIRHGEMQYRLQLTKSGKLILNK